MLLLFFAALVLTGAEVPAIAATANEAAAAAAENGSAATEETQELHEGMSRRAESTCDEMPRAVRATCVHTEVFVRAAAVSYPLIQNLPNVFKQKTFCYRLNTYD